MQIMNPILPGFHADPCICRKGDDYYIAVSSFEWFPGIPVYHSRDMKHWELYTHVLSDENRCDLKRLPSAKGIWAPCLTYCEQEDLFYVVYGVMNSMNARYFDVDNYVITARDIRGPWSEPVYLHSSGFDASMLHDDDGRKWLVALDWETRPGYEKPGQICIVEYDPKAKAICGIPQRIWRGATQRGCLEAPHLTKRNGWYYLMCAEGGTGYYHSVTMARSRSPFGPYEADPCNPIVTAVPENCDERADVDHLKPRYYNPETYLQKCGHASYTETAAGETYLVHLCARPFTPELRCTLGRETAMQKMVWTEDGWLRMADGGNLARSVVEGSKLPEWMPEPPKELDHFDSETLGLQYYAPRIHPDSFCDLTSRPGWLRMRGQESGTSLNKASILARKLTSVNAEVATCLEFTPEVYQQSAGLILYYDNMNFIYLRKYYSETLGRPALAVQRLNNGERIEYESTRCPAPDGLVWMKLRIKGRESQFSWSADGKVYQEIGPAFDTSEFSDEYSNFGEFTGCFVGMTCADRMLHKKCADFDFFLYRDIQPDLLAGIPCNNREEIHADGVQKKLRRAAQSVSVGMHEEGKHHNSYEQEQREQECIRTGDINGLYKSFLELERERVGVLVDDPVRNLKDVAISVITLASRSAIRGGLPAETAFTMSDAYIRRIEEQTDFDSVGDNLRKSEIEFCLAVRDYQSNATTNPLILRCRDLISKMINSKILVSDLAERLHTSPDYLSQLFSREEGVPLSEYIARERIRIASRELVFTQRPIDEIAISLCYSSQSHFGRVFKKMMGMTPGKYRELFGRKKSEN